MNIYSVISMNLLIQLPVIAVWIIGLILAFIFWRKHPKVSILTLVAILGFLVILIADTYLNIKIPRLMNERGFTVAQMSSAYAIKSQVSSILSPVFWILLGVAMFGWRSKQDISIKEEVEPKTETKLHWTGMASLILSISLILIILGTLAIYIRIGIVLASSGDVDNFWSSFLGILGNTFFFPIWGLPLGILNIIMASIAHKADNAVQKNIAGLGITTGIFSFIISLWLAIYLFLFAISYT